MKGTKELLLFGEIYFLETLINRELSDEN